MLKSRVFLLAILCVGSAYSQTAAGTLSGVVRDSAGAVVPVAQVTVVNTAKGTMRTTMTDAQGRYLLTALDAGPYQLRARKERL